MADDIWGVTKNFNKTVSGSEYCNNTSGTGGHLNEKKPKNLASVVKKAQKGK